MTIFADITLVPFSGIQFVTYSFDLTATKAFRRPFLERPYTDEAIDGKIPWKLLQAWNDEDPEEDPPHTEQNGDLAYDVTTTGAIEAFLGQWVPVPYLRRLPGRGQKGEFNFDKGPTNWARAMVVKDETRRDDNGLWYKVVFAFDTNIAMEDLTQDRHTQALEEDDGAQGGDVPVIDSNYVAPRRHDVENPCEYRFVSTMSDIGWFLSNPQAIPGLDEMEDNQIWVAEWLEEVFDTFLLKKAKGKRRDKIYQLEHAARWITLLQLLERLVQPGIARFIDTLSDNRSVRPVDVDLVLDVGNSRTCGMVIENYPNEDSVGLNNTLVLQMRDLQQPWKTYDEPFESHVALSQAWFGKENLSRMSGRSDAFFWPTMVRVGPEATRIKTAQAGSESITGMSAPKRYLWDVSPVNQPWRFPQSDYTDEGEMPPIGRIARRYLNGHGDVLSQIGKDADLYSALYPKARKADYNRPSQLLSYSRSAFYGFMLTEIFFQAMVMVNDPAERAKRQQPEAPRVIRRIILTLPTALPVREQRIMKSRAESAISFIWDIMKWNENPPPGIARPAVHVSWDEASCVQFVWLYGEISRRFGGQIREFFELTGKPRPRFEPDDTPPPDAPSEPSLRVASLDIGGGTTDLMITTYFQDDDRAILPVQTFREGVRIAGDDITKAIIERCLIPVMERAMTEYGVRDARVILRDLFNGDRANMAEHEKHARRQYVQQILVPAALGLMSRYEESGEDRYAVVHTATMAELIKDSLKDTDAIQQYLTAAFRQDAENPFFIMMMEVPLDFKLVALAIQEVMDVVLEPISEALAHFDCDYVLLSGRPTKLAAIQEGLLNRLFVGPDRQLPMGRYRAGNWYPFLGPDRTEIGDPKSCVVVGGVLCAMAEKNITNFMLYTNKLQGRSTTEFVGVLETDGKLKAENVLFTLAELDDPANDTDKSFKLYTESLIGYRQLPFERWVTSPLYHLRIDDANLARPLDVTLTRDQVQELDDDEQLGPQRLAQNLMVHEATKEDLRIGEAFDANEAPVRQSLSISFRTFPLSQGDYWLDSGILSI